MSQVSYGTITITDTNDIERIYIEYAQSTSNSVAPTSDWSENIPAWQQGYYIWQRTVTKMQGVPLTSDSYGDPVCLTGSTGSQGPQGTQGPQGNTGVGVSSITTTYCNYGTGTPTATYSGWQTTVPAYDSSKPNYWVKTVVNYNDGTSGTPVIYKDNGITSATSTAAAANTTANQANQTAGQANQTANQANETANQANTTAGNALSVANSANDAISDLNQYFWRKKTASTNVPAGSYVTNIPGTTYEANPAQGGFNSLVQSTGIFLRNGITTLSEWTSTALTFYQPPTISGSTVTQGKKTMMLSANALRFYDPTNGTTEQAKLDTNGLVLNKGGVKAGTAGQSGFIYLSTENYGTNLTINSHQASNWREIIGTKFGVDADGNLYASNATISGTITVGSGSDLSAGLGDYSTTAQTQSYVTGLGYQTASDVSDAVSDGISNASVSDLSDGSNYSTTSQMNSAIGTAQAAAETTAQGYANIAEANASYSVEIQVTAIDYVNNSATLVAIPYYQGSTTIPTGVTLSYQWYKNGTALSNTSTAPTINGVTTNTLQLGQGADFGSSSTNAIYTCVIS